MTDEKEKAPVVEGLPPGLTYDREVALKQIEIEEKKTLGWQKIVESNIGNAMNYWKEAKEAEYRGVLTISKWIFELIGLFFVGMTILTYFGKVSGDSLSFLIGVIVGYMLSLISYKPRREAGQ